METTATNLDLQREAIEQYLETKALDAFPQNLADATHHIMTLNGKRLRPIMVLMCANAYGVDSNDAMSAAISVEVFHNFTLVHDDIMDQAKLRRGKITVHEKYGIDKAIVAGDAMLPHSISLLTKGHEDKTADLVQTFIKMSKEVMEGQQFDMEFETREHVSVEEYMNMIRLKTSVLFGCSCELGGILGEASDEDRKHLYDFGLYAGLAFQIMDDYLDTFGDENFGKRIGGDILLNKKTFLLTSALEKASAEEKAKIDAMYGIENEEEKIEAFQDMFRVMEIPQIALAKMEEFHQKAIAAVNATKMSAEFKQSLIELGEIMLRRTK